MKKARATKILCAVLTVIMVLGTGLSAMAAVTSTSVVKYNTDNTAYGVTTQVSGLAENEMVTYLVHNASSMYNVAPANIDYIDQKNATGTTATFSYKGTGNWAEKNENIYVGAESITAPVTGNVSTMEEGVAVTVNGVLLQGLNIVGKDAAGIKKIALDYAAKVVDVKYNGEAVEFFNIDGAIGFYTDAALDQESDTIAITTAAAQFVGDPTANGALSAADIINMGLADQPVDSGKATLDYQNGQIANWNGVLAALKNVSGGESVKDDFWYQNSKTIAELGYESTIDVVFGAKAPSSASTHYVTSMGVESYIEAYNGGATSAEINIADLVPNGLALKSTGTEIDLQLTVPATGDYKLVARQNSWSDDRMATLAVNGTELSAVPAAIEQFSFGCSDGAVRLEAGETYNAKLDAVGGNLTRLDFIALVPAELANILVNEAANLEYAVKVNGSLVPLTDEQKANNAVVGAKIVEILAAGNFTEGTVGVKLGTVKVEGSNFVAFGKAKGAYDECGIVIFADDTYVLPALGVAATPGSDNGGFAIELIDEDGVDLAEEFSGAAVRAYAIIDGEDPAAEEGITDDGVEL